MFIFYALLPYFFAGSRFVVIVVDNFVLFGTQKKWSLVVLDMWSPYAVRIVWEFAWVNSALVVLYKFWSYRGGPLNRFDCIVSSFLLYLSNLNKIEKSQWIKDLFRSWRDINFPIRVVNEADHHQHKYFYRWYIKWSNGNFS